ncbi:hypothetical protein MMC08_007029 [Hypocenomyce scalaris]|nr:hypothetical protein [Hypocenomyce scalaris]
MEFPGVALVTGAGSGIGRQTALLYAREGCQKISISDLNPTSVEETKKMIETESKGVSVLAVVCDVANEESVQSMVDKTVEEFGRIDYCANVAGMTILGPGTAEMTTKFFQKHIDVNLLGIFLCERAELQVMLKQEPLSSKHSKYPVRGSIANVSSMAGLVGTPEIPSYTAAKHGVVGITKADGMFYGKNGIRVNTIAPGAIDTPILANSGNDPKVVPLASPDGAKGYNALQRFGDPEEVAQALVWITSDRASYVTAAVLAVNGGQLGV